MKTKYLTASVVVGITLFAMATSCSSSSSSRSTDRLGQAEVLSVLEQRQYEIEVQSMQPMGFPSRSLSGSGFALRIKGDSVYSYLPYVGRSYTPIIGRPDGLDFRAPMTDYRVEAGRRGASVVTFSTKTFEDMFDYIVEVWPNGTTNISVQPNNLQAISFMGRMSPKE